MTNEDQKNPNQSGQNEQAEISTQSHVADAGWVKAVAESAIPNRMWTLSRIDAALGSIA